jgi:GntR family transcriptional regulator / MocR family aminotransferase
MTSKWSTFLGLDLHIELDRGNMRNSVEQALREAVRTGRLGTGSRLPSTRTLAADLGVARGTVSQAYEQLVAEGYLTARQGSGTRVAAVHAPGARPVARRRQAPARPVTDWDFSPGTPDMSMFPRRAWLTATRRVLASCPNDILGYGDPRGTLALRQALAGYLGRARGVVTSPEQVVVCSGYTHGLALLAAVLAARGITHVGFEDPSLLQHRQVVARAGLGIRGVPVDGRGIRVDQITAPAVVVTPAHQYPTGVTLDPPRRAALADWARDSGGLVIEDDYDGEFRYDRQPVGAVQGLAPGHVVYAGTASKTLAPGLRLAWLALPPHLVEPIVDLRRDIDRHPSVIDQLVLADMIGSGGYDRSIRQCRNRYRARRDALVDALRQSAPAVQVRGIAAGLHALLELPASAPAEASIVSLARQRRITVQGLAGLRIRRAAHPAGLVLGYATPAAHAYEPALQALARLLGDVTSGR